ncbi:MAG: lipoprotein signal peptidase [Campylobacterales bacterium]|nr:lipoprotein signal peptidase [Campylobacterales bacterium]
MAKAWVIFGVSFGVIFLLDQWIKGLFIEGGIRWNGEYFSLILTYNKGVAFSMFASLGPWLKVIQVGLIAGILGYLVQNKTMVQDHHVPLGMLLGAGSSNVFDRFVHGGVVDYVFWHRWFEFAVFNFADVMINLSVAIILLQTFVLFKKAPQ